MTALLLIHGRAQEMDPGADRSAAAVAAYVENEKRRWVAGLAEGLVLAGHPAPRPDAIYFPFFGNLLADLIADHERAGLRAPDLESGPSIAETAVRTGDDLVLDAADELGYRPSRRLVRTDPVLAGDVADVERLRADGAEAGWSDLLKPAVVRGALQFLAEKTGTSEIVIQRFMRDVAYYLEDHAMRAAVQEEVSSEVGRAVADGHTDLVVVGHSLGSVVAYDACSDLDAPITVRLLVTAGSPLGFPIVRRNLRGGVEGADGRPVPPVIDPHPGSAGRDRVWWLNAFDVLDVVALVHPLGPRFRNGAERIRDERTFNPNHPHSIAEYLSDPDVAGPIGDVLTFHHEEQR